MGPALLQRSGLAELQPRNFATTPSQASVGAEKDSAAQCLENGFLVETGHVNDVLFIRTTIQMALANGPLGFVADPILGLHNPCIEGRAAHVPTSHKLPTPSEPARGHPHLPALHRARRVARQIEHRRPRTEPEHRGRRPVCRTEKASLQQQQESHRFCATLLNSAAETLPGCSVPAGLVALQLDDGLHGLSVV